MSHRKKLYYPTEKNGWPEGLNLSSRQYLKFVSVIWCLMTQEERERLATENQPLDIPFRLK